MTQPRHETLLAPSTGFRLICQPRGGACKPYRATVERVLGGGASRYFSTAAEALRWIAAHPFTAEHAALHRRLARLFGADTLRICEEENARRRPFV